MTGTAGRSDFHDGAGDAAAYVLGALEPQEAEAFRAHLEQCVVCSDEVETLTGAARALPMSAPQYQAPKRLRRRVIHAVRHEPRAPTNRRTWPMRLPAHGRRWAGALAAAAAAAIVAIAIVHLTGGRGSRVIQARVTGIAGSAQLRLADHRAELIVQHLTPPRRGHVYEVWLKTPSRPPRPASVLFTVTSTGAADIGLPGSLRGVSEVLVTPEPTGGSPAPTHKPVIVAQLTRAGRTFMAARRICPERRRTHVGS